MTTLPTTTPMRLPRPAPATPLALPASMGGASVNAFQMNGSDVWRVIRSNVWLILAMFVLSIVVGVGLYAYLVKFHASYTATGLTQVNPPTNMANVLKGEAASGGDVNMLSLEQRRQAWLLKQEALYALVLQDPNADIRKTNWWASFGGNWNAAKEDLLDNFRAEVVPESGLISVKMSCRNKADTRIIINDIVNRHLENQKQLKTNQQLERSVILNNLKTRYQFRKDDLGRELREKAVRLSIDGMGTPGRLSAKEVELQDLLATQFDMNRNAAEAAAAYKAAAEQVNEGSDLPAVQQEVARDQTVLMLKNQLLMMDMQVGQVRQLGPNHSAYKSLMANREDMQRKLDDATAEVRSKTTSMVIENFRQQKDSTEGQLKTIQEKVDSAKADLGDLTNAMNQYLTLKDDEATTIELLKDVNKQLEQISQSGNFDASTISWAQQPETPEVRSFPRLPLVLSFSVGIGLALALGIAFMRELLDTSVRSPRDIARVGQLNLLGVIPHESEDPQAAGAPLPTVIFQAPHSMLAEQYRQVRSRLQHAASLDSTRSIMVTSPSPGDGKSTVACNLAAGLALNGRRILLVDANFRRPELHKIFGLPNDAGFSAALQSPEVFSQSVCQTQVPNLDVLPCGPRPSNSTELIESQLLIDFIERALEEYDHVIFDSGPFLFVSESVALAPRVDGVITVVRARANSRGLLQRLRDDLRKSKAEHLGVVLNAVRAQAGGYYNRNIKTYYAYQNGYDGK
ncbi:MAG: polysaccharide biosynthesis transport protein [Phycisphaerales bacterium]|jgi:capsular exopolysaccharide synthesis family protein|nr:polysaccharide biosynthesis transport protein [Phycisphaerales bacterium]